MTPSFVPNNIVNAHPRYSEQPSHSGLRFSRLMPGSNLADLCISELRTEERLPCASTDTPMPPFVCFICRMSAPNQVLQPIVCGVSIEVPAFHSVWTRSSESL